jgi:hypothetical protein
MGKIKITCGLIDTVAVFICARHRNCIGHTMLIGFEPETVASKNDASNIDALRELGCERIYTAAEDVFVLDDIIHFLRPGDKLFVADLSRLGTISIE